MNRGSVIVGADGFLGRCLFRTIRDGGESEKEIVLVSRRTAQPDVCAARRLTGDRNDLAAGILRDRPRVWFDTAVRNADDARALVDAFMDARAAGIDLPRLVVTSSIGEYSNALKAGTTVSADLPLSADDSHAAGLIEAFSVFSGYADIMDLTWAVLPMMWGAEEQDSPGLPSRISSLIHDIASGRTINIRGRTDNVIPDGFVGTVSKALVFLADRPWQPGIRRFMVAGLEDLTPGLFIRHAAEVLGRNADIRIIEPENADFGEITPIFPGNDVKLDRKPLADAGFVQEHDWRQGVKATALAVVEKSGLK